LPNVFIANPSRHPGAEGLCVSWPALVHDIIGA